MGGVFSFQRNRRIQGIWIFEVDSFSWGFVGPDSGLKDLTYDEVVTKVIKNKKLRRFVKNAGYKIMIAFRQRNTTLIDPEEGNYGS